MTTSLSTSTTPVQPVAQPAAPTLPSAAPTAVPAFETPPAVTEPTPAQPSSKAAAPEAAPADAKPAKPFSWKDDFKQLEKKGGKLTESGLKLPKGSDANKDGTIDYAEYRQAKVKENSFEGLDKDGSGTLDATELSKMRRYDDRAYGDGQAVTKAQFQQVRRGELRDNRQARLEAEFKQGLSKADAAKFQKYAGADGKLDAKEYAAGRIQQWRDWHAQRQDKLFAAAGGEKGSLDVTSKAGAKYKRYDTDGDGTVSRADFKKGYMADLRDAWKARLESGSLVDRALRDRLAFGRDTFAEKIAAPAPKASPFDTRESWYISQYGSKYNTKEDVPGYDNANCGPTALTMVAKAYGKITPNAAQADAAIEETRRRMGDSQDERTGTSVEGIARGARSYGLDAKVSYDANSKTIADELAKGRLPIVHGTIIKDDGRTYGGHYYVVTKIENGKAYLNDSAYPSGPRVIPVSILDKSINTRGTHGMISIANPNHA